MIRKFFKYGLIALAVFVVLAVLNDNSKKGETAKLTGASKVATTEPAKTTTPTAKGESKINIPGWSDSPYVTRDGQELYFMYSRYNFFPIFSGGKPILEVPTRGGHHNNDTNPFDDSDIYVSKRNADGTWGAPQNLAFNDDRGGCCAMVVEGPPFTLYSQTGYEGRGADLVYRERSPSGTWGKEVNMGPLVNSAQNEDNPHVSPDQKEIWFTSTRPGGVGGFDIWYSKKVNGAWIQAVNVGAPVNTPQNEDQMWISPVDGTAYFNRENVLYKTKWDGARFSEPVQTVIDSKLAATAEISMPDSGDEIFFASPDLQEKRIRIYSAKRKGSGWAPAQPVD